MLYDFLIRTYGQGEPIFLADVSYKDMKPAMLRQAMSRLVEKGQLRRFSGDGLSAHGAGKLEEADRAVPFLRRQLPAVSQPLSAGGGLRGRG